LNLNVSLTRPVAQPVSPYHLFYTQYYL